MLTPPSKPANVRFSTLIWSLICLFVRLPIEPSVMTWKYTGTVALKFLAGLALGRCGQVSYHAARERLSRIEASTERCRGQLVVDREQLLAGHGGHAARDLLRDARSRGLPRPRRRRDRGGGVEPYRKRHEENQLDSLHPSPPLLVSALNSDSRTQSKPTCIESPISREGAHVGLTDQSIGEAVSDEAGMGRPASSGPDCGAAQGVCRRRAGFGGAAPWSESGPPWGGTSRGEGGGPLSPTRWTRTFPRLIAGVY